MGRPWQLIAGCLAQSERPTWHRIFVLPLAALLGCAGGQQLAPTPIPPGEGLVFVPGGEFTMGSDDGPQYSAPAHLVYLDPYWIDLTEVTMLDFIGFVEATGNAPDAWADERYLLEADFPATGILWEEAVAYCEWRGMRLPTEAEWEKAARGTDGRIYPWGRFWRQGRANTSESGIGGPVAVGSYPKGRSPYGALDMAGNVQEWVSDRFDPDYYAESPYRNPTGPEEILNVGLRGGSWFTDRNLAKTFYRNSSHSALPDSRVGFRCAVGHPSTE